MYARHGDWGIFENANHEFAGMGGTKFNYKGIKCTSGKAHPVIHAGDQIIVSAGPKYNDTAIEVLKETENDINRAYINTTWAISKFVVETNDASIENPYALGVSSFMTGNVPYELVKGAIIILRYAVPELDIKDCTEVIRYRHEDGFPLKPKSDRFTQRVKNCVTVPELERLMYDTNYYEYQGTSDWEFKSSYITTNFRKIGGSDSDPEMALRFYLN